MATQRPSAGAREDGGANRAFDPLDLYRERRDSRRSLRRFPALALTAVGIARRASPRLFALVCSLSVFAALVLAAQVVLGKLAIEMILREATQDGDLAPVLPPVVGLVAATAMGGLAAAAQGNLQRLLSERVIASMWHSILDITTSVRLETFESPRFFDDLQRVKTNALTQPSSMTQGLIGLVAGTLGVVALLIALLTIEPLLVPVLLLGGVPLWLITRRSGRLEFSFALAQTPNIRLRFYLTETLGGREEAKEIRAFGLADTLRGRWAGVNRQYLDALTVHVRRKLGYALAAALVTVVATSATVAMLLAFVFSGRLELASAAAALIAVRLVAGRLQQVFAGIGSIFEASLFLRDYQGFVAQTAREPVGHRPAERFEELALDGVAFRYPGADREVLHDVSLSIRRGQVVALIGENGSGKTTLAKLMAGLFEPTAGTVRWNGGDLSELDPASARDQIGVIFQDFIRYQLSAQENVGFGRSEAVGDLDGIREAARLGGADEFLARLPDGYATGLGKEFLGGVDLSLGQWQRVALARAFFRDAAFLVLDEPTASLDARSEHRLFEDVRQLAAGRSLLLISHRFSTVVSADLILVLHEGRIVERGTHAELMDLGGRYAELFEMQARSYRDGRTQAEAK